MVVENWLLQTLSDVFNKNHSTVLEGCPNHSNQTTTRDKDNLNSDEEIVKAKLKAKGEWCGAIAALEQLLLSIIDTSDYHQDHHQGLLLSGPAPVLSHEGLVSRFQMGLFSPEAFKSLSLMPFRLPAAQGLQKKDKPCNIAEFPLLPTDPIAKEQFCLVFTPLFGLIIILGRDSTGIPVFHFSFEPKVIQQTWVILRSRLLLTNHPQLSRLDTLIEQFSPPNPDYRIVMHFSRQLLKNLPDAQGLEMRKPRFIETVSSKTPIVEISEHKATSKGTNLSHQSDQDQPLAITDNPTKLPPEVELLQALTHEIRTPLTTIRTLTRLLLKKRRHFTDDVIKRLEVIDQECSEQINRMELIFRAAELGTTPCKQKQVQLTPISLEQVFQQSIPRWQKQAQRRNVILDVVIPQKLPKVVTDPAMLDQVLTGLMEKFTRSLPTGGQIQVQVMTAGNQIKLQLLSQCNYPTNPLKSLGQLLMFQPETGSLCLNLDVTKNLFQALGGKLIVRNRPQQGEVLTIFLPLGNPSYIKSNSHNP
ncbi:MAG: HAMP domain-containing histidine kinase [Moorea sp. SIO2B7]|nr:HAMP domain-containing histidine kinase [Moorena sp. SIO2B7]